MLARLSKTQPISKALSTPIYTSVRTKTTTPYGRSHIRAMRSRKLPNPVVPHFPQLVYRSDGSSFTHWTTSPRSVITLTRDTSNNPLWSATARMMGGRTGVEEEEEAGTGRMGRFKRRFGKELDVDSWSDIHEEAKAEDDAPAKK
ncbi:hypothetical protein CONPUDRAFT_169897 [Coniophora puteana RWD-64-598 SS2]|uniref:50S ribosomal protein L36 n=1 Tax=Coniophora puteana (strain RWD-64-598) TaxID=741705 RepID=A0A5M3M8C9_CONPW|nr:uncharacterized protein CONPUDRAFT_169897 [Coniophora puteana RWD-64-598 SS2]EIW75045.1 hypothetical protein CONPUDRAFT_169897 [Coniophora puteana RWD-64-598 SS2]